MKRIAIIGAGFAGLSTGIHARRRGYEATVYESHFLPGGMCTSWERSGYTFEGCFHYIKLLGAAKSSIFHPLWRELGALPKARLLRQDIVQTFQDRTGRRLRVFADPAKLETELLSLSEKDSGAIRELCAAVRRCYWFTRRTGLNPFLAIVKLVNLLRAIPFLARYGELSLGEYSRGFEDPLIRRMIARFFEHEAASAVQLPMFLGMYRDGGACFPEGGSLAFARLVEATFLDLGGRIEYRSRVARVLVRGGRAAGVQLEDGSIREADIVVSTADGHATLFELLDPSLVPAEFGERYAAKPLYGSFVQVSLGLDRDLSGIPPAIRIERERPLTIGGKAQGDLWFFHYGFDPTMAPAAKSSLVVLYASDYDWWERLGRESEAYRAEKRRILEATLAALEEYLPGVSDQVEASDVATPLTMVRYTGNWRAALGFMPTGEMIQAFRKPVFALPSLAGFFMAGQWVQGMGVPNAAMSGKNVLRAICAAEGMPPRVR